MSSKLFILALLFASCGLCFQTADAQTCEGEISHPILVAVPVNANPNQTALIVANAVLNNVNNLHPSSTRCNVAIYSFNVSLKRGFLVVPMPPSLAGEIKQNERWEDILPGLIWQRLGLDPDDAVSDMEESNSGASLCGANCTESSFRDIGLDGVQYQVSVTYLVSFSCSGSNCTLTYTIIDVMVTRVDDGSPYFGTALAQNTTQDFGGED